MSQSFENYILGITSFGDYAMYEASSMLVFLGDTEYVRQLLTMRERRV
jgi:hypothetical protein